MQEEVYFYRVFTDFSTKKNFCFKIFLSGGHITTQNRATPSTNLTTLRLRLSNKIILRYKDIL